MYSNCRLGFHPCTARIGLLVCTVYQSLHSEWIQVDKLYTQQKITLQSSSGVRAYFTFHPKYQTGYSVVSCCALTFTVATVHYTVWNAYDDKWVHLCIYLFMCSWITFGWFGNYCAKVSIRCTQLGGGGGIVACDIFMIGEGGVNFGRKKRDIFWMAPMLSQPSGTDFFYTFWHVVSLSIRRHNHPVKY